MPGTDPELESSELDDEAPKALRGEMPKASMGAECGEGV
jgi:hypothetical protein